MTKCKLLIVDSCEDFPMALAEILKNDFDIQYCLDGKEALALIRRFQPEILLLELTIPGLDGISLLQKAADERLHPLVLTLSRFYNDYTMAALEKLNICYCLLKPCDVHATAERIRDARPLIGRQSLLAPDPQLLAGELLFSLGLATKHHGYAYLMEALILENHTPDQSVTKHLYPAIAAKFHCSQSNVEHSIRTAIHCAWKKRDDAVWQQYFLPTPSGIIPRPTNAAFISRLAQELRHRK